MKRMLAIVGGVVLAFAAVAPSASAGPASGTSDGTARVHRSAAAPAAQSGGVTTLATANLGLSTTRARYVQCWLKRYWNYTDSLDGQLGTNSWKAFQRNLKAYYGYTGSIDGDPGPNTIRALQRLLRGYGYTGSIDGDPGSGTQAAFKNFADWTAQFC